VSTVVSRRQARRAAFVLLYQLDVREGPLDELYAQYSRDTGELIPGYTREAVDGASGMLRILDRRLDGATRGWSIDRLGAVERAILRLALWELAERLDVPVEVAIDEAVELAKRYASAEAAGLVNGVLGRLAREEGRT
jgi:transcription antitermination protein NusB